MSANIKELVENLKVRLSASLKSDPTLGTDIEKLHTLLSDEVTPPAPAQVAFKEFKTKEGKTISVEGELVVGSKVNEVSEAGSLPAADGEYYLEDGTEIKVTGGLITYIKPAEATPPAPAVDPTMMAQMEAQKNEIATLKMEVEKAGKDKAELVSIFKKILEAPVQSTQMSSHSKIEKPYNEMNNFEKTRYNRGETIYK